MRIGAGEMVFAETKVAVVSTLILTHSKPGMSYAVEIDEWSRTRTHFFFVAGLLLNHNRV